MTDPFDALLNRMNELLAPYPPGSRERIEAALRIDRAALARARTRKERLFWQTMIDEEEKDLAKLDAARAICLPERMP